MSDKPKIAPSLDLDAPPPELGDDKEKSEVWERDLVNRLAFSAINEQRRSRRWSVFFRFMMLLYVTALLVPMYLDSDAELKLGKEHTAVIKLDGIISSESDASADKIVTALRKAFKNKKTKGVILRINSPGGSPVQSNVINREIKRLRAKYPDIPLYAVVMDLCASGGYYVAVAADKIYADKSSLIGSIGVRMDGFGFVGAMEKLGIERRLLTAGDHKGMLDPFQPQKPEEVAHIKGLLKSIHQQFVDVVKEGRGDRLKDSPNLFSGYIWTGVQALDMGLIDDYGTASMVARDIIGAEEIVDYTTKTSYLDRLLKGAGTSIREGLMSMFTSFGLR